MEPFEYDSEEDFKQRPLRKPLTKNQHLYGDDWEESNSIESDEFRGEGLPSVSSKLPKAKKFVRAEVITQPEISEIPKANIKFAAAAAAPIIIDTASTSGMRRNKKQEIKEMELESKLTVKYGKALKMLQKSSGYQLG